MHSSEYGSTAWDPYRMYQKKNWLAQVQRRAGRLANKTYSRQEGCYPSIQPS